MAFINYYVIMDLFISPFIWFIFFEFKNVSVDAL